MQGRRARGRPMRAPSTFISSVMGAPPLAIEQLGKVNGHDASSHATTPALGRSIRAGQHLGSMT